jgi:hypothetical protein
MIEYYHARVSRYIQYLQNVPMHIANVCIDAIKNDNMCLHAFKEWNMDHIILYLRQMRPFIPRIQELKYVEESTSFDDGQIAINEIFCFHPNSANKYFERSIHKNPFYFHIYLWMGECCEIAGGKCLDFIKILRLGLSYCELQEKNIERDMQVFPNDYQILLSELLYVRGFTTLFHANLRIFTGNTFLQHAFINDRNVFTMLHESIDLLPQHPLSYITTATSYLFCPIQDRQACLKFCINLCQFAINLCGPKYSKEKSYAHMIASQAHILMEENDAAIEHLNAAISLEKLMFRAYWQRAQIYTRMKKYDLALADTEEMLHIHPERDMSFVEIYYIRAVVFTSMNEKEQAIQNLYQAMSFSDNNGVPHITLMKSAVQENNFDKFHEVLAQIRYSFPTVTSPSHVASLLANVMESFAHFNHSKEANKTKHILENLVKSWYRID